MFKEQINDPRDFSLKYARQLGWLLLACGITLGVVAIVLPILLARNGDSSMSLSYFGGACSVSALCFAPGYIIGGRRFVELIWPQKGQVTFASVFTLILVCLINLGVFFGLRAYLGMLGFTL
jgi:hypothetical protein